MEARVGIEPTRKGFADLSLTTWVPRRQFLSITKTCALLQPAGCRGCKAPLWYLTKYWDWRYSFMFLVVVQLQEGGSLMSATSLEQLEVKGADLRAALARIGDMRPGSLSETYGKCGKPTCHCAKSGSRGHGPSWLLTRTVDGKTVAQRIPSGPAVQQSKQQVAEYKRFRELARELIEISDQICDLRLKDLQGVREVETKKKRHRRKSAR